MEFLDTRLRVQHPCPFCDVSVAYPDARMAVWCSGRNELLTITAPRADQLDDIVRAATEKIGVHEVMRDGRTALTAIDSCTCWEYRSVTARANEFDCWLIPPTRFHGGWEMHRVLSTDRTAVRKLVQALKEMGSVEVVSTRTLDNFEALNCVLTGPMPLLDGFTEKQITALVSAYENGLLDVPARGEMEDVAKAEGLSRSTYGEHLRKATLQLVRNCYPVLKLYDRNKLGDEPK
jgi:hypothetical protein